MPVGGRLGVGGGPGMASPRRTAALVRRLQNGLVGHARHTECLEARTGGRTRRGMPLPRRVPRPRSLSVASASSARRPPALGYAPRAWPRPAPSWRSASTAASRRRFGVGCGGDVVVGLGLEPVGLLDGGRVALGVPVQRLRGLERAAAQCASTAAATGCASSRLGERPRARHRPHRPRWEKPLAPPRLPASCLGGRELAREVRVRRNLGDGLCRGCRLHRLGLRKVGEARVLERGRWPRRSSRVARRGPRGLARCSSDSGWSSASADSSGHQLVRLPLRCLPGSRPARREPPGGGGGWVGMTVSSTRIRPRSAATIRAAEPSAAGAGWRRSIRASSRSTRDRSDATSPRDSPRASSACP